MFMALRQKAGIWLPTEQRLPSCGDAETQHLPSHPSSLASGTTLSWCLRFLLSARPGRGSQSLAYCSVFSLGLLFFVCWVPLCVPCPGSEDWEINPKAGWACDLQCFSMNVSSLRATSCGLLRLGPRISGEHFFPFCSLGWVKRLVWRVDLNCRKSCNWCKLSGGVCVFACVCVCMCVGMCAHACVCA